MGVIKKWKDFVDSKNEEKERNGIMMKRHAQLNLKYQLEKKKVLRAPF